VSQEKSVLQRADSEQERVQQSVREQWLATKLCKEEELASSRMMRVHKQESMTRILITLDNSRYSSLVDKKTFGVKRRILGHRIVLLSKIRGVRKEMVMLVVEETRTGVTGSEPV
jgi:hypothetical protein